MDFGVNYNQKCWAHLAGLIKIMENYDKMFYFIMIWWYFIVCLYFLNFHI